MADSINIKSAPERVLTYLIGHDVAEKGGRQAVGGVGGLPGPLDGSGKIPASQLPPLEHDVGQAASQAAMLALPVTAPAVCIRTDFTPAHVFYLTADPATTLANWVDTGEFGAGGANPSAQVALTAVNGAAATFMRSDGAPALNQAISPTWTGTHTFQNDVTLGTNKKVTFSASKSYEVLAANIGSDDRLIFRTTNQLAARYWFDTFAGSTGLSFAEGGTERVYFGTKLGGGAVLDTKTYELEVITSAFHLAANGTHDATLDTSLLTATRLFRFPDKAGTLLVDSDAVSGTYAPTVTPGTNVASATANGTFMYSRIGNIVTVAGSLDVTASGAGPAVVQLTLPVAPSGNFSDAHKLSGSGAATNGTVMSPAYLRSLAGGNQGVIDWIAPSTAAHTMRFTATYTTT